MQVAAAFSPLSNMTLCQVHLCKAGQLCLQVMSAIIELLALLHEDDDAAPFYTCLTAVL